MGRWVGLRAGLYGVKTGKIFPLEEIKPGIITLG
jgi:hypothetical protein